MKPHIVAVNGLLLSLFVLTGAGCMSKELPALIEQNGGGKNVPAILSDRTGKLPTADGVWRQVDEGIERMEYYSSDSDASLTVYRFQADRFTWHFANGDTPRLMEEWGQTFPSSVFVMNGVFFNEDYSPSGFLAVSGTRVGERQFDFDKSGLIDFTSGVRLVDTARAPVYLESVTDGGQAYPFFIKERKDAIKTDTERLARRSFIGTDTDGRVYLGVSATQPLSLYELMGVLREMNVRWWDTVLNLDGGPSTGFVANTRDRKETVESYLPVPNVIVVERK